MAFDASCHTVEDLELSLRDQTDTAPAPISRPGGRAARIQAAVLEAVETLRQEKAASEITVPMIAARAGVTPSTIYRRWGDLSQFKVFHGMA